MKTLLAFLLTATVAFAQTKPAALKDGSNVDPATWRGVLDVPQTSALSLSQGKLAGRGASSGTGSIQEITLGTNLTLSGTTLNAAGDTVDNATVNTAIGTNPTATQQVLGTPLNVNLGSFAQAFRSGTPDITIVQLGDSLAGSPLINLGSTFPQSGGYLSAVNSIDGGSAVASQITVQSGSPQDDWTYMGGRQILLPYNSSRIYGEDFVTTAARPMLQASKYRIWYVVGPGTLRVQVDDGVGTTWTNVTTANSPQEADATVDQTTIDTSVGTTGAVAYRDISFIYSDFRRFKLLNDGVGTTIKILGIEAYEDTSGSRINNRLIKLNLGGSYAYNWDDTPQANITATLSVMNPAVIVFKCASFHVTPGSGQWQTMMDRVRVACPKALIVLVGNHPWDDPEATPSVIDSFDPAVEASGVDAEMKAYAIANGPQVIFADTRKNWPNYARMASAVRLVVTDVGNNICTSAPHIWSTGDTVTVYAGSGGALPSGLSAATTYYVIKIDANTYKLATSSANATAGTAIDITTAGTQPIFITTGGAGLISETDGIHLSAGIGAGYQSALLNTYIPTLVGKPEVNSNLNIPTYYTIPEVTSFYRSGYGKGPNGAFYGDLKYADGEIAFYGTRGTAGQPTTGPKFKAWGSDTTTTTVNCRIINGYSIGTGSGYNIHASPNANGRLLISELTSPQTTLLRDFNAQLEVVPTVTSTKPGLAISLYTGHTGAMLQGFTGTDLGPSTPTAGTSAFQFDSTGNLKFDATGKGIVLKAATNGRIGTTTLTSGTVTVPNTSVTANTHIIVTRAGINASTAIGNLNVTRSAGTNFTITALKADATTETNDVSTVEWQLTERQ